MLIRRAQNGDAAMLAEIHRESRQAAMPWLPALHTPVEDLYFFESSVLATCTVTLAQHEDQVLGFCAWRAGWIDHLYVRPSAFRKGVGANLMQQPKSENTWLYCWTYQRNVAARTFLERHGFAVAELSDGQGNEEKEPDVLYLWRSAD